MAQCGLSRLWGEVLMTAMREKDAAQYLCTDDFETVATLAGLDPEGVRSAFDNGLTERDARRGRPLGSSCT